jgi:putative phosphoesterase
VSPGTQPLAAIADVHGNRWALEAVLEDLERRGVRNVVNLGDSLYGPLDPGGTARLLRRLSLTSVRGNMDRTILEPDSAVTSPPTLRFVREALDAEDMTWLGRHIPPVTVSDGRVLLCHGTPWRDDVYLAERVTERGVEIKTPAELASELAGVAAEVILCGHSHTPRVLRLPDERLVVNPGSVGLPAYTEDSGHPHWMEAGSPHARYCLLERQERGWRVEHVAVPYDWERAAREAAARDRPDWAAWLRTGRAR